MRPRQLSHFLAVCRHGSMSAAAQEQGIAQPALSKQIMQLEHELQVQLFERHSRGISLTRAGERLRIEAAELIRRMDSVKDVIRREGEDVSGTVVLAVIASLAPALAVSLYPRMEQEYPGITLHIADDSSQMVGQALIGHRADLAILPNAAADLPAARSEPLFEEHFHFISRTRPGSVTAPIRLAEAAAEPLVLPFRQHDLRRRLDDAARTAGVTPNIKYETASINVISAMVEQGLCNTIVPTTHWLGRIAEGHVTTRPITDPAVTRVHSLCWMPDRSLPPAARVVQELLPVEIQALLSGGKLAGIPAVPRP
jgi:LysR family nitrogen assimilation transcriptional regulator